MSKNVDLKKQVVQEIVDKVKAAKSVVLIDYRGLTVSEDTEFRREFRSAGCEYKVLKNTLLKRAFNEIGVDSFDNDLNGQTAVAFCNDETTSAKIIMTARKKYSEKITVKSGYVDGAYQNKAGIEALASIPSKPQLVAMLAGTLNNLIAGLAIALNKVAEKNSAN